MEVARRSEFLAYGRQKELAVRPVEASREEVGALPGIKVNQRVARQRHVAVDVRGTQPRNEPRHRVNQGRLAAPRTSGKPNRPAGIHLEVEITQYRPRLPSEANREPFDCEPARGGSTRGYRLHHPD